MTTRISMWILAAGLTTGLSALGQDKKDDHHEHPSEGPHHGCLAEWGDHDYHVEFTVDRKTGTATVYVLDVTAKKAKPVDAKEITLTIKGKKAITVDLKPSAEKGEKKGAVSRFVGTHKALKGKDLFKGTLSAEIGGKPYSGDFEEEARDPKKDKKDK